MSNHDPNKDITRPAAAEDSHEAVVEERDLATFSSAGQYIEKRKDTITVALTGVLVFVAILQRCDMSGQLQQMQKQVQQMDLALESAQLDRRAWVGIKSIRMTSMEAGKPIRAEMVLYNSGKTFAVDLVEPGFTHTSPTPLADPVLLLEEDLRATPIEKIPRDGVLFPDSETTIPFRTGDIATQAMIDAINKGEGHIYLVGRIEYADVFKRPHVTRYFRHYLPDLGRFELASNAFNDAN